MSSVAVAADAEVCAVDLRADVDESVLSAEERRRGAEFVFDRDRVRFRRRRSQLRHFLAPYAGRPAAELQFEHNAYGRPTLVGGAGLEFSSSSSADLAMFAVGGSELGVDVELIRPALADAEVARRMFAPEEAAAVAGGTAADFFRCWTRKEAYVKATGQGLSYPLTSFAIEVGDVARPQLCRSDLRPDDLTTCTIVDLSGASGELAAAVVVRARDAHVMMRWTTDTRGLQL